MNNLERQLLLVLDGRVSFDTFASRTRREFERMATYLMRKWVPPSWCVLEDVVQELLLGTWIWMWGWDRARGPSVSRYVVFNAMSHAKRSLHKARGAKLSGSSDKNPSHIERPLSSFGQDGDGEQMAEAFLAEEPVAESRLIAAEEREVAIEVAIRACETVEERVAIVAIAEAGDVDGGGALLYGNDDAREALGLPNEKHAARFVARLAGRVMGRLDGSLS